MDRISILSDDVLIRILSFVGTKDRIKTSVLAKRYEHLWKYADNLRFVCNEEEDSEQLRLFLNETVLTRYLSPEIKRFTIKCWGGLSIPEDIKKWVDFAIDRQVKRLSIAYENYVEMRSLLPNRLYSCKSLVSLNLYGSFLFDIPDDASLHSLRFLEMFDVLALTSQRLVQFLSICPGLTNLILGLDDEPEQTYSVVHSSLLNLKIVKAIALELVEIRTPSLKYLEISATSTAFTSEDMPNLEEANVSFGDDGTISSTFIQGMKSVKKLTICVNTGMDFFNASYHNLEYLKLCDCGNAEKSVHFLLASSPNITHLDIKRMEYHVRSAPEFYMIRYLPLCTFQNLKWFGWSKYEGLPHAEYVLHRLRGKALLLESIFISFSKHFSSARIEALVEFLESVNPASGTCELHIDYFGEDEVED